MNALEPPRSDRWLIAGAGLCFAALSLAASVTSQGFLEADGCTHYLYARYAFAEPHYLVNIWGRPLVTAYYAIFAMIGERFAVRCSSLLLALAIAWIAHAIARSANVRRPALAIVFTLAQPLLFLHSFSELTELPFAALLGLTFIAYGRRRWLAFALLASLLPLARPEGFGFVALAALALLGRRRWIWLLILPIPLIIWSRAGWQIYGATDDYAWPLWLIRNWPYAPRSTYDSGSTLHFLMLMPAIASPLIWPATILGAWRIAREFCLRKFFADHDARSRQLILLIPLMILVGHSVLYATGRMASNGELRYMLIVAPFWAVLANIGWTWFFARQHWPREAQIALLAALAPIFINRGYQVIPLTYSDDWLRAERAATWIQSSNANDYPRIQTAHPGIAYLLDRSMTDRDRSVEWRNDLVKQPRDGVILIWDWVYATHNSDRARVVTMDEVLAAGWVPISAPTIEDATRDKPTTWKIFRSPRDAHGQATAPSR